MAEAAASAQEEVPAVAVALHFVRETQCIETAMLADSGIQYSAAGIADFGRLWPAVGAVIDQGSPLLEVEAVIDQGSRLLEVEAAAAHHNLCIAVAELHRIQ